MSFDGGVSAGFKQTEIGPLPEDWDVVAFGDHFTFQNGVNADKRDYGKGIRFANVLEIITHTHLSAIQIPGQVQLSADQISAFAVRNGDILFNRTSETQDEVGLASVYMGVDPIVFGGFVIRGRPISEAFDPLYTGYAFRAPVVRAQIVSKGQGAVRANIGQAELRTTWLPLPPLPEQRAIAEALSDLDGLIAELEALVAKKRDLKQAAAQTLLTGQIRLPGFSGKQAFSEIGTLPQGWAVAPLGACSAKPPRYGINAPAVPYSSKLPRYLRITDITDDGKFSTDTPVSVEAQDSHAYQLQEGDIVVARTGASVGRSYLYRSQDGLLVYAGFLIRFSPDNSKLVPKFLAELLRSDRYWKWVESNSARSGQPGINAAEYASFPVQLPSLEEQTAIATVLSDIDAEIEALETQLVKTRDLKTGMMQDLLTGRVRLTGTGERRAA